MKRTASIFIICAALLFPSLLHAQTVNGLALGKQYTYEQVLKALGKPDSSDGVDWYDGMDFKYEDFECGFNDGWFSYLRTESRKLRLFKDDGNEGIRVGDHVGNIFKLIGAYPKKGDRPNEFRIFTKDDWRVVYVGYDPKTEGITYIEAYTLD